MKYLHYSFLLLLLCAACRQAPDDLPNNPPSEIAEITATAPARQREQPRPPTQAPRQEAEQETAVWLATHLPLERDDVGLAMAYKGLRDLPDAVAPSPTPFTLGQRDSFTILNTDENVNQLIEAELRAIGDHAYFWFDTTPANAQPTAAQLTDTAEAFDDIYEQVTFYFGVEDQPGIDGDLRIHIVNASPLTICTVTQSTAGQCGLLGYFGARDTLPVEVDARSNGREMFVMNGRFFGSDVYLEVLAHEFRHMIEHRYDKNDIDWEVEGSAMLAEDLLGYPDDAIQRANAFLARPDQQLNRWTDGNPLPYYGQGYLLNRYIYDRLGTDLYRLFAQSEAQGLQAVTDIAAQHDLGFTGLELWRDWLVASAIHDHEGVPALYDLPARLNTAASETVTALPASYQTMVNQYAADYYTLDHNQETMTLAFQGDTHVPLLAVQPTSGQRMWLANRANFSQARLTRTADLRAIETATLTYNLFHDIEVGYDFAYAAISTDDGRSWVGLSGEQMQSKTAGDDPGEAALTEQFYTGQTGDWVAERIDLTPYAGQIVQIRFEYITDPILTFGGIALDDIAIPEIDFVDDAEQDQGWTAEGFVRATGTIPQTWHLQLVRFVDGVPLVEQVALDETQRGRVTLSPADSEEPPILIIAATAPMTLNPAHYELLLER